jgi:hypothetical protein
LAQGDIAVPALQTYSGGCHCGRVRYQVTTTLEPVLACNCSICQKRGALWTYVAPAQFKLLSGQGELSDYQFNKKAIHHLFCRNCGIASFATGRGEDGSEGVGINVRCLEGVEIEALALMPFDGRSL